MEPFSFDDEEEDQNNSGGSGGLDDEPATHRLNGLDLDGMSMGDGSSSAGWGAEEMLLTNQTKYGYKSTYNSDLSEYTLPVEKENTEEYKRREEEAEKLANEIESSAQYRINVDKELSDNEEEEEAFSAVVRSQNNSSNTGEINNNTTSTNNNMNSILQLFTFFLNDYECKFRKDIQETLFFLIKTPHLYLVLVFEG